MLDRENKEEKKEEKGSSLSLVKPTRTVAFLEVEGILIKHKRLEQEIKESDLNNQLINELLAGGIKDVYLSITFPASKKEIDRIMQPESYSSIQVIKQALMDKGITVHDVIMPPDYSQVDTSIPKEKLVTAYQNLYSPALEANRRHDEKDNIDGKEVTQAFCDSQNFREQCGFATMRAENESKSEKQKKYNTEKGLMCEFFLKYAPSWVGSVIAFDTDCKRLDDVVHAHSRFSSPIKPMFTYLLVEGEGSCSNVITQHQEKQALLNALEEYLSGGWWRSFKNLFLTSDNNKKNAIDKLKNMIYDPKNQLKTSSDLIDEWKKDSSGIKNAAGQNLTNAQLISLQRNWFFSAQPSDQTRTAKLISDCENNKITRRNI